MAEPHCDATSGPRRRGAATKRATAAPPCGACKFLRRKCISGCVFAPHFGSEQGAARFAAVHKVFGASNVSKLLLHIPANRRREAAVTIIFEAQARLSDPVYGCVSTILALQQQVASMQAELATVQSQLRNRRFAFESAIRSTPPPLAALPNVNSSVLQPAYSNNSSVSTNLVNMSSCFDPPSMGAAHSFKPPQLCRLCQPDEDEELESKISRVFNNGVLHP